MCVRESVFWWIGLTSEPGGEDLWVCELGCDYCPDLVVCKGDMADPHIRASGQPDQTESQSHLFQYTMLTKTHPQPV